MRKYHTYKKQNNILKRLIGLQITKHNEKEESGNQKLEWKILWK